MLKRNIFLIFVLLLLICSIDMIQSNASKSLKKTQDNHLDKKLPRKLEQRNAIKMDLKVKIVYTPPNAFSNGIDSRKNVTAIEGSRV